MSKKFAFISVILASLLVCVSAAFAYVASPVPPSKGQWGFALESSLPLYEKADSNSDSEYVDFDGEWFKVPSAVRDNDNMLWYKVKIGKKSGWLAQNGIRLKLQAGKSKSATNLYKSYRKNKSALQPLLGLDQDEIRSKLGTPTMRETPYEEADVNILSYELSDRNMTLVVTLRGGEVEEARFFDGRAGQTDN
ncbi:MAG: hypothetical protein IJT20_02535 [Synergistaceae bacterium]|nr:hypothetical protein [Synergistaceae bacterium]